MNKNQGKARNRADCGRYPKDAAPRGGDVLKTLDSAGITDAQMKAVNRYTRRELTRDEVFVFSVILCDNEVDRDLERFPTESLKKLGELFLGSTGVFDHAPKAENQSARIFETALETGGTRTSTGEEYCALKAWAYMVRCDKNADLILEIDGGIKKEVSVGCAVDKVLCSVCGADAREGGCGHKKGGAYGKSICHHLLTEPTDAYEWSFVAVPAQKKAGVVKRLSGSGSEEVLLTKELYGRLERMAAVGERYEAGLRRDVVRLGLLSGQSLDAETIEKIAEGLEAPLLEALCKSYEQAARRRYPLPPSVQLARKTDEPDGVDGMDNEFKI